MFHDNSSRTIGLPYCDNSTATFWEFFIFNNCGFLSGPHCLGCFYWFKLRGFITAHRDNKEERKCVLWGCEGWSVRCSICCVLCIWEAGTREASLGFGLKMTRISLTLLLLCITLKTWIFGDFWICVFGVLDFCHLYFNRCWNVWTKNYRNTCNEKTCVE